MSHVIPSPRLPSRTQHFSRTWNLPRDAHTISLSVARGAVLNLDALLATAGRLPESTRAMMVLVSLDRPGGSGVLDTATGPGQGRQAGQRRPSTLRSSSSVPRSVPGMPERCRLPPLTHSPDPIRSPPCENVLGASDVLSRSETANDLLFPATRTPATVGHAGSVWAAWPGLESILVSETRIHYHVFNFSAVASRRAGPGR